MSATPLTFRRVRVGQRVTVPGWIRGERRIAGVVAQKRIERSAAFLAEDDRRHGLRIINVRLDDGDDGSWYEARELRRAGRKAKGDA